MATESIKSIRSSGGDYTSLSAWEAGEERDLVTADEIAIAECYDDWPSGLNDSVTIGGTWVSDSTRYPIIRCATGHGHDGTPGSGFHVRHSSVSGTAITVQVSYTRVIGLDVGNSTGSGSGIYLAQDGIVEQCLCTTNGGNGITLSGTAGKDQVARNNLCYECSADGIELGLAAARYVYNNTCVGNSGYGIDAGRNSSSQHIKNNLCSGNTSGDFNWAGTSIDDDYNASADTTATGGGGANSVNSQTFSFVDAANDDYHLSAATAGGTDLSAATYGFTDDVDGDTRSNWDFGFDEYASSGTTVSVTDAGSGADSIAQIAVALGLADSGAGADSLPGPSAALAMSDTGTGADALTMAALAAISDAGTGVDADPTIGAHAPVEDTAAGTDAVASISALASVSDTGVATDAIGAISVVATVVDSGAGADAVTILTEVLKTITDAGSGSDAIAGLSASLQVIETAAGTEQLAVAAQLSISDAGSFLDAVNVITETLKVIADSGVGADGLSIAVAFSLADLATGSESLSVAAVLQVLEAAAGTDAVVKFEPGGAQIVSMVFSLGKRQIVFALAKREIVFSLN